MTTAESATTTTTETAVVAVVLMSAAGMHRLAAEVAARVCKAMQQVVGKLRPAS